MKLADLRNNPELAREAKLELARQSFYDFCQLLFPQFYQPKRQYLRKLCDQLEDFAMHSPKKCLVVNCPPRHGKSLTAQALTAWLFGQNPAFRVMTASYNERLSGLFARSVRNLIQTEKVDQNIVYSDLFDTKIKYGEASASMWTIEGQSQVSYLATSPSATATGMGCDFLICDDLIKNAEEAYNQNALDDTWDWFRNTMLQRLEGRRKIIIIMTRWAEGDLAGRILKAYADEVEHVSLKALQPDGTMLCADILDRPEYDLLTREMNADIIEANYNQTPIDVAGRLYQDFKTWQTKPDGAVVKNYTDTADTGKDYLCSVNYFVYNQEAYITNLVFSDKPMEQTEQAVARLLHDDAVQLATVESNNGGRGFARNVERILREGYGSNQTVIEAKPQTKNKESRILASSAWVQNHVYMPLNWQQKYPEFYKQLMSYQRKGKNAHDDAPDVLAAIYEDITALGEVQIITNSDLSRRRGIFER